MSDPPEVWKMMYACIALHNFIRLTDESVDYDLEVNLEDFDEVDNEIYHHFEDMDYNEACAWRNQIALDMWEDYLAALHAHGGN
jgi:hypothetical protein